MLLIINEIVFNLLIFHQPDERIESEKKKFCEERQRQKPWVSKKSFENNLFDGKLTKKLLWEIKMTKYN